MDFDIDCKPLITARVTTDSENKSVSEKPDGIDSNFIDTCGATIERENPLLNEETKPPKKPEDIEVDIVIRTNIGKTILAEAEDPDATECSSSFGNTVSDTEKCSGLSEAEVESQFFDENDLGSPFSTFDGLFQTRKKLTNHWRNFIHPLMWRCKWIELKIKEFESQELKYTRELAACEQRKHSGIYPSTSESFCSKSLPFSNQCFRRKAMKRRKRKRVEDATNITSYMLHHNLFSYLENKKSNSDGISMVDDFSNAAITDQHDDCNEKFGIDNDKLVFDFGDGDNSLEQMLWRIENVHFRVSKLKNQLDKIMTKNAAKFSSSENLNLLAPCDAQTSSAPSPAFSAGNGETTSVGGISNTIYNIEDMIMPESAISSYGEAIHIPDITESTVGLLSAAEVNIHQPQIGNSCEDIVENVLIHNEASEGEGYAFVGTSNQLVEKHQEAEKGEEGESTNPYPILTSELDQMEKKTVPQGQSSTLNSFFASNLQFPRNKRKRGERKAGSGGWNKKCSSEPDSQ